MTRRWDSSAPANYWVFRSTSVTGDTVSVIVLGDESRYCGLAVDRFIGEQDLAVRPLDPRLGKVPHISAAAVTESGEPLLILDIDDLLQSVRQLLGEGRLRGITSLTAEEARTKPRVLVVDDSITVREVQRQLLTLHGYDVEVAVDGQDGWHALSAGFVRPADHGRRYATDERHRIDSGRSTRPTARTAADRHRLVQGS